MTVALRFPRIAEKPAWSFASDGSVFDLAGPDIEAVCFIELARSMAGIRRFNGRGISDAQHCAMGAQAILNEGGSSVEAALFLLHDAHEGLIGDIIRPVEALLVSVLPSLAVRAAIETIKRGWDGPIYAAANLPHPDLWTAAQRKCVKDMDDRMCAAEAIRLFGGRAAVRFPRFIKPKTTGDITIWGPARAEEKFLELAYRLIGEECIVNQADIAAQARASR